MASLEASTPEIQLLFSRAGFAAWFCHMCVLDVLHAVDSMVGMPKACQVVRTSCTTRPCIMNFSHCSDSACAASFRGFASLESIEHSSEKRIVKVGNKRGS
eukprot:1868588-Amphidinium_carterae.1